jgi:hypothetical protein
LRSEFRARQRLHFPIGSAEIISRQFLYQSIDL